MQALLIIDVQNDFLPGGALEVPEGARIIPVINRLQPAFDLVVATQDWHPPDHISFATSHPGKEPFDRLELSGGIDQTLWPEHCVQNSEGAEFSEPLETAQIEAVFRKGTDPKIDSYSGFFDNAHQKTTGLDGYLREKGVEQVFLTGLAADVCVYFSAKDALDKGFSVKLIEDAVQPLDSEDYKKQKQELQAVGVNYPRSRKLL